MKRNTTKKTKQTITKNKRHDHEIMARDLDRVIKSWARKRIPVDDAVELSIDFMVNFAFFACKETKTANHLIISAISRELIHSGEMHDSETAIH